MQGGRQTIDGLFAQNRLLEVPFYQRTYVWGEDQWERFLQDMEYISATRRPYFLGSVILKQAMTPSYATAKRVTDTRVVIDGQQRMTTIMLFFKALGLLNGTDDDFKDDFCLKDGSPKFLHGRADAAAFGRVISLNDLPAGRFDVGYRSNVADAFNYFLENIDPDKVDYLAIKQNVLFISIDVDFDEDEQQVFDTINSLGVKLTTAELLKNHLFSRDNEEDYCKYWEAVFEADAETRDWWEREVDAGRNKRTLIDLFFDSLLQILVQDRAYGVSAEDKAAYSRDGRLFHSYQDFLDRYYGKVHGGRRGGLHFLEEMDGYARAFREAFDPLAPKRSVSSGDRWARMNVIVFGLKNTTLVPYLLYVAKNVPDDRAQGILAVLESYVMRRIATRDTTKNYNRMFSSMVLNGVDSAESLEETLLALDDSLTRFPDDGDLAEAFRSESRLTNLQAKGIIYLIEVGVRHRRSGTSVLPFDSYSLEHLMPKKWRNNWEAPGTEEQERERDAKLRTLGNLALVTQSLNASIRDAGWERKREGRGEKAPGLKACSGGLATFEGVLEKDVWDEKEIDRRAGDLAAHALTLWPYPNRK